MIYHNLYKYGCLEIKPNTNNIITIKKIVLCIIFLLISQGLKAQKTTHLNTNNIYCIGNGKLAAYFTKANIIQLFGAPYSSPSILEMILNNPDLSVNSKRITGSSIWTHSITKGGSEVGTIVDFIDSERPVLIRQFNLLKKISFTLSISSDVKVFPNKNIIQNPKINSSILIESPRGKPIYNDYPMPFKQCLQISSKGTISILKGANKIICEPGEGTLYFIGGPEYPDCAINSQSVFADSTAEILEETKKWWKDFTDRRFNFDKLLPYNLPQREKLLKTIDDVAINIKTQQSVEGGILAGHNYHLGYVRDQYGVSRCLLKLGYMREAKQILNFYWKIWQKHGVIKNAQGLGVDLFHEHENDQVEITGYLILQAFNYLDQSKDESYMREIYPMLEWAWDCQIRNLIKNMLPFNGDETYVAGGILPRSALNDGSAESTLLFITSGKRFINWVEKNGLWGEEEIRDSKIVIRDTEEKFRGNFVIKGTLYTNNPDRIIGFDLAKFRHGVCESTDVEFCNKFGWTQKNLNNRYLCSFCFVNNNLGEVKAKRFNIQSVSLVPLYIGSNLFDLEEISNSVNRIVKTYKASGKFPSRMDGNITVGYDYGLLLYNLSRLNHPLAPEIYSKMLSVLDTTGSWVEYYLDKNPMGTRYRPWESSINMEAAIEFALIYKHKFDN